MLLFLLMAVGAFLEVVGIGAIPAFIALLMSSPEEATAYPLVSGIQNRLGATSSNQLLLWAGVALVAIFLIKNVYLSFLIYAKPRFAYNRYVAIATRLFDAYLKAPYPFHLTRNTAELLRNTNTETIFLVQQFMMPGLVLVLETLVVVFIAALLILFEPVVSVLAITVLGAASFLFYKIVRRRAGRLGLDQQHRRKLMIQTVNEGLGGVKDVKVLGRESHFLRRFTTAARDYARAARYHLVISELPGPFVEVMAVLGMLLVAAALLAQGKGAETIVPTLALFGVATIRLMPSIKRIMKSVASLRFYAHAVNLVHSEIATVGSRSHHRLSTNGRGVQLIEPAGLKFARSLSFENVSFRYDGAYRPAVDNVSLTIRRGSAVGFVGPSGAGKSTLVGIMLGVFAPSSGRLRVDDHDLHGEGLVSVWQRKLGYIPQNIFLADTSIRRNIAFGLSDDEIDEDAIRAAVEAAQLSDLVRDLPAGLDTVIGERGVRLSGGQVQRIAIARALYHQPEVLIMDEATSSVDHYTETRIVQTINDLRSRHTLITIAHRPTTVQACDWIYRIDAGRIVSEGMPADVLEAEVLGLSGVQAVGRNGD